MKLAEALQVRGDLQKKAEELRLRLNVNATYQEGEQTAEDPEELKQQLNETIEALGDYITRINLTNTNTQTPKGSLTALLARKEVLLMKRRILDDFGDYAANISPRHGRNEIKMYPAIDVSALRKEIDALAKEIRELDLLIQETNWLSELM